MYIVDNAIILAAGVSSRFVPLSFEKPKALTEVKGEVLIERQIRQLQAAGIQDIYIIVGYKAEQFAYLQDQFNVTILDNKEYMSRNNHSSIYAAREIIRNTYICSADNYFQVNPFEKAVSESYYAAVYAPGDTHEWCMQTDEEDYICRVEVGGRNTWYMLGHAFWSEDFSRQFLRFLDMEYDLPQTKGLFWENIFVNHLDVLKMKMRPYPDNFIFEFDSIDELRAFDDTYIGNTRSAILKNIAEQLGGTEAEIVQIEPLKDSSTVVTGVQFSFRSEQYCYTYADKLLRRL